MKGLFLLVVFWSLACAVGRKDGFGAFTEDPLKISSQVSEQLVTALASTMAAIEQLLNGFPKISGAIFKQFNTVLNDFVKGLSRHRFLAVFDSPFCRCLERKKSRSGAS
jgi:hypothetical protein